MVWDYVVLTILGVTVGFVTGLIPGLHINLVAAMVVALSSLFMQIVTPMQLAVVFFSAAVAHNLADNIPTTFLGAPASENITGLLPAQKLLMQGRGADVLRYGILGIISGVIGVVVTSPVLSVVVQYGYKIIEKFIPYILLGTLGILIVREKKKLEALLVVLMAGILGILVLSLDGLNQPLLPMFSGLFGLSTMFMNYYTGFVIPSQKEKQAFHVGVREVMRGVVSGFCASLLTSFLPGLSSSHTSLLATSWMRKMKEEMVVFLTNFCNTVAMLFGLIAFFAIEKTRSGVVAALTSFVRLDGQGIALLLAVAMFGMVFSVFLCLKANRLLFVLIAKIKYRILCGIVIVFIVMMTLGVSGLVGLGVLVCCWVVGVFANMLRVSKNLLMACIMLPVALYMLI